MSGKVLCVNKRLLQEPDLLWQRPHDMGYLAIVALQKREHAQAMSDLMTVEAFAQVRQASPDLLRNAGVFTLAELQSSEKTEQSAAPLKTHD